MLFRSMCAFTGCASLTISCEKKKPLFPFMGKWDKDWLGASKTDAPKVLWNCKNKPINFENTIDKEQDMVYTDKNSIETDDVK